LSAPLGILSIPTNLLDRLDGFVDAHKGIRINDQAAPLSESNRKRGIGHHLKATTSTDLKKDFLADAPYFPYPNSKEHRFEHSGLNVAQAEKPQVHMLHKSPKRRKKARRIFLNMGL
jgi:hypothetical protein